MQAPSIGTGTGSTDLPSPAALDARVQEARRLFGRTLASWASDCLVLRARGLDMQRWTILDDEAYLHAA